jgi:Ca-activated chloride channel family protein
VATNEDTPSQGELRAKIRDASGRNVEVPLPLEHTDVKASVSAFVATVDVTQRYRNPYDTKIEAVYVFPLPQNAAVTDFIMTIGKRRIRGIIREREEARKIYREAKRQGYTASLLTQERPNIFTQRVANIEPSKSIGITIRYFNTLKYSEGKYEFVFPMVVGPRYNPPGSRGGVGAVARGRGRTSGQPVEVQYLKPGERSGHDISLTLDVDAGVEVEDVKSHTHAVDIKRPSPSRIRVTLSRLDTIPNKDFVFRYKVAGKKMKTAFLSHTGKKGSHFALVLQPPENMRDLPRMPREMVFVLDCSGSMRGWPMEQAKKAMRRCLTKLGPDDTFQVIRFSNRASSLGPRPLPATSANVRRGLAYVKGLHGSGGTRMIEGIRAALDFPHDPKRLRIVSFMTDGYIGNEKLILAAIHDKLGAARIFSFGVGNSVNRYLLESMARMGKGAVAFVGQGEGATDAVDMFYDRCSRPAMTNIQIDWGSMKVDSVYPRNIPDLFVGRPVIVTGRYQGSGLSSIRVSGRSGFEDSGFTMNVDLDAPEAQHQGIAKVWARKRLAELAAHMTHEPSKEIKNAMTDLSLEYSVQCGYTAFLAVDTSRVTRGASGVTVAVPVPVPDGVRYDTTVGGE